MTATIAIVLACVVQEGGLAQATPVAAGGGDTLRQAIAAATGEIAVEAGAVAPRIALDPEPRVVLPPAYAAALAAHDPEFRPWNLTPYPDWLLAGGFLELGPRHTPFAVIGDLNGDGRADVVIDGHAAGHRIRMVLMTDGDDVRVLEHHRLPLPTRADTYRGGFGEAIDLVPPGTYESAFEDAALVLETDAFEWLFLEKAAMIIYWRDGRFHEWISAD